MNKQIPYVVLAALVLVLVAIGVFLASAKYELQTSAIYRPVFGSVHCAEYSSADTDYMSETLVKKGNLAVASHICLGGNCKVGRIDGASCSGIFTATTISAAVNGRDAVVGDIHRIKTEIMAGQGDEITINVGCFDYVTFAACSAIGNLVFPIGGILFSGYCASAASYPGTGTVYFDYDKPMFLEGWADGAPFPVAGGKDCIAANDKLSGVSSADPDYKLESIPSGLTPDVNSKTVVSGDHSGTVETVKNNVTGKSITFLPYDVYKLFVVDWEPLEFDAQIARPTTGKYAGQTLWCSVVDGNRLYKVKEINGMQVAAEKLDRVACCPGADISCSGNKVCDENTFTCVEATSGEGKIQCSTDTKCIDKPGGTDESGNSYWLKGVCSGGYCTWQKQTAECHTNEDCYAKIPAGSNRAECSYFKCYYYSTGDISAPCSSECCLSGSKWNEKTCTKDTDYCETHGGYVGYCKDESTKGFNIFTGLSGIADSIDRAIGGLFAGIGKTFASITGGLIGGAATGLEPLIGAALTGLIVVVGGVVLIVIVVVAAVLYLATRRRKK